MKIMLLIVSINASAAWAQSPTAQFPLNHALETAQQRNPEIAAARADWETARARVISEKTWKPPQIGVEYMGFHGADVGAVPERWFDVSQEIPFPGKLHFRGAAAEHEAWRLEDVYHGVEQDVFEKVKAAYYRCLFARRAARILEDNVEVMRRFSKTTQSRYATGKTSQSDALRAEVELSKTLAALVQLEQEREAAEASLNALLDRSPDEPIGELEEPRIQHSDLAMIERAALAHRPEVLIAEHHVDHTRSLLTAARSEYLPDFSAQYTRRTREGLPNDSIAMFKMSLPFLYFWRPRSETSAAAAQVEQAKDMLRSQRALTLGDAKAAWTRERSVARLLDLYRTSILPEAQQSVKVSEAAYQSDRLDFLGLLDSQRALLEFRLDYERYLLEYGVAMADLERIVGTPLDRVGTGLPEEHHEH